MLLTALGLNLPKKEDMLLLGDLRIPKGARRKRLRAIVNYLDEAGEIGKATVCAGRLPENCDSVWQNMEVRLEMEESQRLANDTAVAAQKETLPRGRRGWKRQVLGQPSSSGMTSIALDHKHANHTCAQLPLPWVASPPRRNAGLFG